MSIQVPSRRRGCSTALAACLFLIASLCGGIAAHSQTNISPRSYEEINNRAVADQSSFYVYLDQDSGFNHGFPSGFMGTDYVSTVTLNAGCVDPGATATTCLPTTSTSTLDQVHGTVLSISIAAQPTGNWAGLAMEEPMEWLGLQYGNGYNLTGATSVTFQVRSPNGAKVQFGVGGCTTAFTAPIPSTWTTVTLALNTTSLSCTPDISDTHLLFEVVTNDTNDPTGATVELDNIQFTPVPTEQASALTFPIANQTFGIVPQAVSPIPNDQVLRNLTTIYESSLAEFVLLARGTPQDLQSAELIANTFDYALHNDSNGDPIPTFPATGGATGLHNGYENGDIGLYNNQPSPLTGLAGNIRLSGFTDPTLCDPSGYCLVLDGATGGNNAFAMIALIDAYRQFGNVNYLNDAIEIGDWIVGNLTDTTGTDYGGYYVGYNDYGTPPPKPVLTGKSIENNADIFGAFTNLASVETQLGNTSAAAYWTSAANVAGDFVMQMYDPAKGSFNVGTSPYGTTWDPDAGNCPNNATQKGTTYVEVINTCGFLDVNTFTTLPMANSPRYKNQIDWRLPVQYALNTYAQSITDGTLTYDGFDLIAAPISGANGVTWEMTGQMVETMNYVDQVYNVTTFQSAASMYLSQIAQEQNSGPFADGLGLPAATMQDTVPPSLTPANQCLNTPYQCFPERVGLAATSWSILAEKGLNYYNFLPYVATNPTTTTLTSSPNPSISGQTANLTATVRSSGGTPTGTVTFYYLNTAMGAATLSGGVATLSTTTLPEGTDSIIAMYNGGSGFAGSNSNAVSQTVLPSGTSTVTLTSSASPTSLGEAVTFTAEVLGWAGGTDYDAGTGTVTFYNRSTVLGTVSSLSWGWEAQLTTTALPQGTDSITAVFSGNSSYTGSTSNVLSQVVTAAPAGPQGYTLSVLHTFTGSSTDGSQPEAGLAMDASGNLYGTTLYGGAVCCGEVFKVTSAGVFSQLHNFNYLTDGGWPATSLVLDASGNLYGATSGGGHNNGTIFKLTPAGAETTLYSFTGGSDDGPAASGLLLDSSGNLYGTGSAGWGNIFKVTQAGVFTVLHSFTGQEQPPDGGSPEGGLVQDASGNLYGTTVSGGTTGWGTVYKTTTAGTESLLYNFTDGADGGQPRSTLVLDSSGNIYGTASDGGNSQCSVGWYGGCGTVFKVSSTGVETTLHAFNGGTDGALPSAGLVRDALGNLYGTTDEGGWGYGTVFKVSSTGTETVLYSFTGGTDGAWPEGSLVYDAQGNLYGAAYEGGIGAGTVYKLTATTLPATTTALKSSVNPSSYDQSVTFTATVTGQFGGTPTGTVTFKNGSTTLGSATLSGGVATYTTAALAVGTSSITAVYGGSSSFTGSTSSVVSQVVSTAATTTTLASSANPSKTGSSVTFTATVTGKYGGTPTGTVTFKSGSTTLGSATLSAGVAKYSTTALAKGTDTITATYGGSTTYATSSATLAQTED